MSDFVRYRTLAAEAARNAAQASGREERLAWLDIERAWLSLAREVATLGDEDDAPVARGRIVDGAADEEGDEL